jgi:nucleoside triphosphate diphosphatase
MKRATVPRSRKRQPRKAKIAARPIARAKRGARPESPKSVGQLFEALVALQAQLRAPGGCPWDREQTHVTLRPYLVEETYEVLDALDSARADKIADELGDLLLQVIFHAELGREAGRFDIGEVIERVHTKMVRRHPHVFGDVHARTSGEVLKNWEQLKAEERKAEAAPVAAAGGNEAQSILDGVSAGLPALIEAQQLSRRAANVGFDWPNVEGILEKLVEETAEIREFLPLAASAPQGRTSEVEEEIGDLLFVVVNLARFLGFDAEIALKRATRKFKTRFKLMEGFAREAGRPLAEMNAKALDRLWERAKSQTVPEEAPA